MKKGFTSILFAGSLALSLSGSAQVVFSETFESAGTTLPSGWAQVTAATDGGFKVGTAAALSSSSFPIATHTVIAATNDDGCNCNKANELLTTPAIDLTGLTSAFMSADIFFFDATYQGASENASIEVSTDGGTTFTVLRQLTGAGDWRTEFIDLSQYAGQTITLGFRYQDGGGWLYGLGVDNVSVYVPAALDVQLASINVPEYAGMTPLSFTGTIFNAGTATITALDVAYTINGGSPVSTTVGGLNIAPLTSGNFTHPTSFTAPAPGDYTVAITISNPNGGTDANTSDNSLNDVVRIASQTVTRLPLVEMFSSNTCPPCASFNAVYIPLLVNNNTNHSGGLVAAVKYQMDYPSPGTDVSFNADADTRHTTFYGVGGIPSPFIDGVDLVTGDQAELDAAAARPAIMDLSVDAVYSGNTLTVTATATPYYSFPAGLKLYIAVTEDFYTDSGTNGETEFHYVQRKMLPNGSGNTLAAMMDGTPVSVTKSANFTFGNVTQGSYNLWGSDFSGNTVVVWVQDPTTREVFQAAFDEDIVLANSEVEDAFSARFFPNPSNDQTFMRVDAPVAGNAVLEVYNMLGQRVDMVNLGQINAGNQTLKYDSSNLADGIHMYSLTIGGKKVSKLVTIAH